MTKNLQESVFAQQQTPFSHRPVLVCFAINHEARPFISYATRGTEILITGMGALNAATALRKALRKKEFGLVLSCGFAGGLNPKLKTGDIVYNTDANLKNFEALDCASSVNFLCRDRIAVSATEKKKLHETTHADAVEMESAVIRQLCAERSIPSATIRVVSDGADEDLPLDFNLLMTKKYKLSAFEFGKAILRQPRQIGGLIQLQKNTTRAAKTLANVLNELIREWNVAQQR